MAFQVTVTTDRDVNFDWIHNKSPESILVSYVGENKLVRDINGFDLSTNSIIGKLTIYRFDDKWIWKSEQANTPLFSPCEAILK